MKRLFLSLVIIACISLTVGVDAQNSRRGGQQGLSKELNLTVDQQKKIESVNSEFKTKMDELRAKTDLTKEDKQAKMKDLRDQHHVAINKELTPEQQTKFKELQEKGMKRMQDGKRLNPMRGQDKPNMKMRSQQNNRFKNLNLTDDQKQKIKALNDDYRAKSKELSKQHREALNQIYTPEQQAKLKEMRGNFSKNRKFAFDGRRIHKGKLDDASIAKMKTLRENFEKEKKAVELSRIAPDAQKKKISDLRNNFRKEKRQIIEDARKAKVQEKNPV